VVLRDDTVSAFDFLYRLPAIVALFQLILALLGLFLPGWLFARSLRMPAAWAAAMPLSALVICQSVVVLGCLGWRIEFWRVAAALVAVSGWAVAAGAVQWADAATLAGATVARLRSFKPDRQAAALAGFVAVIVALFAVRVTLFPLSGWDTFWRWEWLARVIFTEQSLGHYPPTTAADFAVYPYAEGIPPLVGTVYWWLYGGLGAAVPRVTAVAVVAEYVSLLGLVHAAAERLSGRGTGWLAAAAVAATPLLTGSVAIGQETGFTALAVAGQILCGLAARETPSWRLAVACGLFTALGSLAREYGPALGASGFLLLAQSPATRRFLPVFVLAAATAGLWYARNWALTGNPVYSTPTPLGLPANPVHALYLAAYKQSLGLSRLGWADARTVAEAVMYGGLATLVIGTIGAWRTVRVGWPLVATIGVVTGLWAWSVGYTAGGVWYSLRVLSPAWTVLAVLTPAGIAAARSAAGSARWLPIAGRTVAASAAILAVVATAIHPLDMPSLFREGFYPRLSWAVLASRPDPATDSHSHASMVRLLEASQARGCGILTDDAYFAVHCMRAKSRFWPVMTWSPAAAFLFDPAITVEEACAKLADMDVRLAFVWADPVSDIWRLLLSTTPFFRDVRPALRFALGIKGMPQSRGVFFLPSGNHRSEPAREDPAGSPPSPAQP
jgi:hypothetical protein